MTTTYITNATAGAPTLTGAIGSLISLLDFCLVTTLGWTKAFTGTNTASYQATTGNRFYLGIDDTTTLNARLRGFETMTAAGVAVASGTGPFPTDALQSGGDYVYKSSDTTTARNWWFASDGKMFYLSINATAYYSLFSFGDFISNKSADAYNTVIIGESASSAYTSGCSALVLATATGQNGSYLTRAYTGVGGAKICTKCVDGGYGHTNGAIGSDSPNYPSDVEGALLISRIQISEALTSFRGRLPGLWAPMHSRPLGDGDTFTGSGDFSGRTFVARNISTNGQVLIETSDTWRS